MGRVQERIMIVHSCSLSSLKTARAKAKEIFSVRDGTELLSGHVGTITQGCMGGGSFQIASTGSKVGWTTSNMHKECCDKFGAWLEENQDGACGNPKYKWATIVFDENERNADNKSGFQFINPTIEDSRFIRIEGVHNESKD